NPPASSGSAPPADPTAASGRTGSYLAEVVPFNGTIQEPRSGASLPLPRAGPTGWGGLGSADVKIQRGRHDRDNPPTAGGTDHRVQPARPGVPRRSVSVLPCAARGRADPLRGQPRRLGLHPVRGHLEDAAGPPAEHSAAGHRTVVRGRAA